jgi:hypothetical protein
MAVIAAERGAVGHGFARFVEEGHQAFQVLGRCGEDDLLVHFPRASVAGAGQAMGLLGFAEQVLDAVPEFSGKLVTAGG